MSSPAVRLTADVVLISRRGDEESVLLIQRRWDPYAGCWALPGGHVDDGEEVVDAARRELVEETGIRADDLIPMSAYASPRRDPRGRYVTFAFVAVMDPRPDAVAADDAAAARWWPVSQLGSATLAFDHRQIIVDALDLVGRGALLDDLVRRSGSAVAS